MIADLVVHTAEVRKRGKLEYIRTSFLIFSPLQPRIEMEYNYNKTM
jgi:hypothetical protein